MRIFDHFWLKQSNFWSLLVAKIINKYFKLKFLGKESLLTNEKLELKYTSRISWEEVVCVIKY